MAKQFLNTLTCEQKNAYTHIEGLQSFIDSVTLAPSEIVQHSNMLKKQKEKRILYLQRWTSKIL